MKKEAFTTDVQTITNNIKFPGGGNGTGGSGNSGGDDGDTK